MFSSGLGEVSFGVAVLGRVLAAVFVLALEVVVRAGVLLGFRRGAGFLTGVFSDTASEALLESLDFSVTSDFFSSALFSTAFEGFSSVTSGFVVSATVSTG